MRWVFYQDQASEVWSVRSREGREGVTRGDHTFPGSHRPAVFVCNMNYYHTDSLTDWLTDWHQQHAEWCPLIGPDPSRYWALVGLNRERQEMPRKGSFGCLELCLYDKRELESATSWSFRWISDLECFTLTTTTTILLVAPVLQSVSSEARYSTVNI